MRVGCGLRGFMKSKYPSQNHIIPMKCVHCGIGFLAMPRQAREGRKFCSKSCAKRHSNPTKDPAVALKISLAHIRNGHGLGINRGGNGKLTHPQILLQQALGKGWQTEYAISLGCHQVGYPSCYKVDIGNKALKIAIEVDGGGHSRPLSLNRDLKKSAKLAE